MTDATLLQHIERLPHARANFKQLARELSVKGEGRAELEAALERIARLASVRPASNEPPPDADLSIPEIAERLDALISRLRTALGKSE